MEPIASEPVRTRRSVLDLLLGLGFFGFIASAVYPVLRYLKPMAAASPNGPLKLSTEEAGKLQREHSVITRMGSLRVLVFEDAQQQLRALDARCTHEGCTVQYVPGDSVDLVRLPQRPLRPRRPRPRRAPSTAVSRIWVYTRAGRQRDHTTGQEGDGVVSPEPQAKAARGLFGWLDERYGLTPLVEFMRHKEVPVGAHSMVWYYLGGATLFFFMIQVATGALLLLYYQAGEQTSYESIRFITTKVPFGWLVRSDALLERALDDSSRWSRTCSAP